MENLNESIQTLPLYLNDGEIIGFTYLFEDDTELTLDLTGELIDYSGMGYNRAKKYLTKLN